MQWQRLFDNLVFATTEGAGFSFRFSFPSLIRYVVGDRELTLISDLVDRTDLHGRRLLFLRNYYLIVTVPERFSWDDGSPLTAEETSLLMERLRWFLTKTQKQYFEIEVNQELYDNIQADVDAVSRGQ